MTVVELAPPGTETPLFRGECEREMKGRQPMAVGVPAEPAIAGVEAGRLETRPGVSDVLEVMSRAAPGFMFKQMVQMSKPRP